MKLSKTFVDNTELDINWDALETKLASQAPVQKEAAKKDAPVTEKQLDPARGDCKDLQVTEVQLEKGRKDESAPLVEKQLDKVRQQ